MMTSKLYLLILTLSVSSIALVGCDDTDSGGTTSSGSGSNTSSGTGSGTGSDTGSGTGSDTGSGSGGSSFSIIANSGPITSLDDVVGVYDWSDDYGAYGYDEWYFVIEPNGDISDYDYEGDSYDMGRNCYWEDRAWGNLTHISDNVFYSDFDDENVTLSFIDNNLFLDFQDGSSLEIGPQINAQQSDFQAALCD